MAGTAGSPTPSTSASPSTPGRFTSAAIPVSQQTSYMGSHVSQAARIEPVTPPGQVYASQAFVALVASERARDFTWDYVGHLPLAKNYGTYAMYNLRWLDGRMR